MNKGKDMESPIEKQRDSNLELMRIIVMIFIIMHHYVVNSGLTNIDGGPIYGNILSMRSIFLLVFGGMGKTGINCFLLITGYFMCKSQITAKKFVKLLTEIMFYNIVLNVIFWAFNYEPFTFKEFIKGILPVTEIGNNFVAEFLVFFLFIPFLNILIHGMNQQQHIKILILCSFTYIFFGTFHRITMNYVSWFMILYLISSFIRLYPRKIYKNTFFWGVGCLCLMLLSISSIILLAVLYPKLGVTAHYFVADSNSILPTLTALCCFMFFKNLKIKYSKVINVLGGSTFGVLLIHANSNIMRRWLWKDVFNCVNAYQNNIYIHACISVFCVFVVCSCIDMIRIHFIEKPFMDLWDEHFRKVDG